MNIKELKRKCKLCRSLYRKGKLDERRVKILNRIGFDWNKGQPLPK